MEQKSISLLGLREPIIRLRPFELRPSCNYASRLSKDNGHGISNAITDFMELTRPKVIFRGSEEELKLFRIVKRIEQEIYFRLAICVIIKSSRLNALVDSWVIYNLCMPVNFLLINRFVFIIGRGRMIDNGALLLQTAFLVRKIFK